MSRKTAQTDAVQNLVNESEGMVITMAWLASLVALIVAWGSFLLGESVALWVPTVTSLAFLGCNLLVLLKRRQVRAQDSEQ